MIVELLAPLHLSPGIVELASPGGPLEAALGGHVGLQADDRGDPGIPAGPVEVQHPVHVAVVGDPEGGLGVGHRCRDRVGDARRPVQHGELGVGVKVTEGVPRRCHLSATSILHRIIHTLWIVTRW